jgi:hypothetical protein
VSRFRQNATATARFAGHVFHARVRALPHQRHLGVGRNGVELDWAAVDDAVANKNRPRCSSPPRPAIALGHVLGAGWKAPGGEFGAPALGFPGVIGRVEHTGDHSRLVTPEGRPRPNKDALSIGGLVAEHVVSRGRLLQRGIRILGAHGWFVLLASAMQDRYGTGLEVDDDDRGLGRLLLLTTVELFGGRVASMRTAARRVGQCG